MSAERATLPPPAASAADLARRAERLLEDYAAARATALRCASEGYSSPSARTEARALTIRHADALSALADHDGIDDATGARWACRADCARWGIVDDDTWGVDLLALAYGVADEARATEPGAAP